MSEVGGVGARKYVEISSEETLPPGELWKAEPKGIDKQTTISSAEVLAVTEAALFAGVHVKGATAEVVAPSIFVRG